GFSYGEGNEAVSNTKEAAKDVYAFLQIFLQTFTKYQPADFHVTGESYAGHYIPQIGATIAAGNAKAEQVAHQRGLAQQSLRPEDLVTIHLDSLAIGNGLTDALVQYKYYPDMACDTKYGPVLTNEQCDQLRGKYETSASLVQSCYKWKTPFACVPATMYCNNAMIGPFQQTGRNVYDVRTDCAPGSKLCYPILEDIEAWLNLPAVQSELGVDRAYQGCNFDVNRNFVMQGDWPLPFQQLLVPLLESGVRILIYAGDADYICNWIGNKAWIRALEWSGQDEFENAEDVDWKVGRTGKVGGKVRAHENLTFLQIYEAGHMVPYDQPEAGAEMIETWIQKKNFA
ncbi:peptidase S10, serine carboxypeptidase, partial [Caulochytrium protostelioides]